MFEILDSIPMSPWVYEHTAAAVILAFVMGIAIVPWFKFIGRVFM